MEITPELVKAVLRTDAHGLLYVSDNDYLLRGALFVMPKGTLISDVRGDCSYVLASICDPLDVADFSAVGGKHAGRAHQWLLSTASSSYEEEAPEIISAGIDLEDGPELHASILKPVPEELIAPTGLVPLNDTELRYVCLHLGWKLLLLANIYWSRIEGLRIIDGGTGRHYRQTCPPEFFWSDFHLNEENVRAWEHGTLTLHKRWSNDRQEPGVDGDWVLPKAGSPRVYPPPRRDEPAKAEPRPVNGWRKLLGLLLGTE